MSRRYTSRVINNAEDTVHMQSLLKKKPKMFFNFPEEWQEWFMTHPEMLEFSENHLSIDVIRDMLYGKMVRILVRDNWKFGPEVASCVALLMHSGLSTEEIKQKIELLSHKKSQ